MSESRYVAPSRVTLTAKNSRTFSLSDEQSKAIIRGIEGWLDHHAAIDQLLAELDNDYQTLVLKIKPPFKIKLEDLSQLAARIFPCVSCDITPAAPDNVGFAIEICLYGIRWPWMQ